MIEVFEAEQELQELRAIPAAMAEQLRVQNGSIAAKDTQTAALTEQAAKLTTQIEELTHKKNSNYSSKPPSEGRLDIRTGKRRSSGSRNRFKWMCADKAAVKSPG